MYACWQAGICAHERYLHSPGLAHKLHFVTELRWVYNLWGTKSTPEYAIEYSAIGQHMAALLQTCQHTEQGARQCMFALWEKGPCVCSAMYALHETGPACGSSMQVNLTSGNGKS
jgi:hypothetical protein